MPKLSLLFLNISVALLMSSCAQPAVDSARWYSPEQVASGTALFEQHCAGCHGDSAQGDPNWQTARPDGSFPPPPLNGSGHAWHHPLTQLDGTIANGGTHPGASMPGFAQLLNKPERLAVIAAFQSYWDAPTYRGWLSRGGLSR